MEVCMVNENDMFARELCNVRYILHILLKPLNSGKESIL